jgi:hypothetical protein
MRDTSVKRRGAVPVCCLRLQWPQARRRRLEDRQDDQKPLVTSNQNLLQLPVCRAVAYHQGADRTSDRDVLPPEDRNQHAN